MAAAFGLFCGPSTATAAKGRTIVWFIRPSRKVVMAFTEGREAFRKAYDTKTGRPIPIPPHFDRLDTLEVWVVKARAKSLFVLSGGKVRSVETWSLPSGRRRKVPVLPPKALARVRAALTTTNRPAPRLKTPVPRKRPQGKRPVADDGEATDTLALAFLGTPPPKKASPRIPTSEAPDTDALADAFLDVPAQAASDDADSLAAEFLGSAAKKKERRKTDAELDDEVERIMKEEALDLDMAADDEDLEKETDLADLSPTKPATAKADKKKKKSPHAHKVRIGYDGSTYESPQSVPPTKDTTVDVFLEHSWDYSFRKRKNRSGTASNRLYLGSRYLEDEIQTSWTFTPSKKTKWTVDGTFTWHDVKDEVEEQEEDSQDANLGVRLERKLPKKWATEFKVETQSKSYSKQTSYAFDFDRWEVGWQFSKNADEYSATVNFELEDNDYPTDPGSSHQRSAAGLELRRNIGERSSLEYSYDHTAEDYDEISVSLSTTTTGADYSQNSHELKAEITNLGKATLAMAFKDIDTNYANADDTNVSNVTRTLTPSITYTPNLKWTITLERILEKRINYDQDRDDFRSVALIRETSEDYKKASNHLDVNFLGPKLTLSLSATWGSITYFNNKTQNSESIQVDGDLLEYYLTGTYKLRKDLDFNLSFSSSEESYAVAPAKDTLNRTISFDFTKRF